MTEIIVESGVILLLLIANGVFAMAEIAVVSARKAMLRQFVDNGDARARAALELAESPNRFLATVQIESRLSASSREHSEARPLPGRVPVEGEWFEQHGFRVEVIDMDGHRVDKVLLAPLKALCGIIKKRRERSRPMTRRLPNTIALSRDSVFTAFAYTWAEKSPRQTSAEIPQAAK